MCITAIGTQGRVILTGSIDEDPRIDGAEEEVGYEVVLYPDTARLVADDIDQGHAGVRLYDAEGTVGPVDDEILEVLEMGVTEPTYRLTPEDHATLDDLMDGLVEARFALGYDDSLGLSTEPVREPDADSVLSAGDALGRAVESLAAMQSAHGDEDDERQQAAAIRASELAQMDQWDAEHREAGRPE